NPLEDSEISVDLDLPIADGNVNVLEDGNIASGSCLSVAGTANCETGDDGDDEDPDTSAGTGNSTLLGALDNTSVADSNCIALLGNAGCDNTNTSTSNGGGSGNGNGGLIGGLDGTSAGN